MRNRGRSLSGWRRIAPLLLALCAVAGPAGAEDAPGAPVRLDFDAFRAPAVPRAASGLWVPTDDGYSGSWTQSYTGEVPEDGLAVQTFQEPWTPLHALAPEVVEDLLRRLVSGDAAGAWASRGTSDGIEVWTTTAGAAKVARALDFVRAGFAPRLSVQADLLSADAGGATVPRASGATSLLPRRWTTVLRRRDVTPQVVGCAIEVAQESVVARPLVASLPTGEEVYARWTPGETVSVLEVFVGDLDAREGLSVDLTALRLTPDAGAPARVTLPRIAVRRARTAMLLPAGRPTETEVLWTSADGPRRLRLRVEAPAPAPEDLDLGSTRVGVVRAGAATTGLEDAPREGGPEAAIRAFQSSGAGEVNLEPLAQAFVLATGEPGAIERLRASVRRAEAAVRGGTLEVSAVQAPPAAASALRDAVVGRAVPPAAVAALDQGAVLWSVRLPVLGGVPAVARAGSSVAGFADLDAAVAQSAGGLVPAPGAWFDGLAVTATVTFPASGGARLRLAGTWSWADPKAASAELAFRMPIPLSPVTSPAPGTTDEMPVRRVTVPLAGHGALTLDADLAFSADDLARGQPVVVAHARTWPAGDRAGAAIVVARLKP
jgi:hypothetical protein